LSFSKEVGSTLKKTFKKTFNMRILSHWKKLTLDTSSIMPNLWLSRNFEKWELFVQKLWILTNSSKCFDICFISPWNKSDFVHSFPELRQKQIFLSSLLKTRTTQLRFIDFHQIFQIIVSINQIFCPIQLFKDFWDGINVSD